MVQNIKGIQLEELVDMSEEEKVYITQACKNLGLAKANVDWSNPGNFIRNEAGLYYIDNLFYPIDNYFEVLILDQLPIGTYDQHPDISPIWVEEVLEKLNRPRNLSISKDGQFEIFDKATILKTLQSREEPIQRRALKYLDRLQQHQQAFPKINLTLLKARLSFYLWKKRSVNKGQGK